MFKTRLISGIVLVAIALVVIITGGNVLLSVMGIISLIGMFELYRVFQMEKSLAAVVGYLAAIAFYLNLYFGFFTDPMILPMLFLILLLAVYVFSYPKYKADQIMACFFALFYVAMMLSFIYQTRMLDGGEYLVWLIFLCSWGSDTCAYCVGMLFGKHQDVTGLKPEEICRRCRGRCGWSCTFNCTLCIDLPQPTRHYDDRSLALGRRFCHWSVDFYGGRSGGFCDQT